MAVSSADQRRLAPWPRFGSGALETVHVRRLIDVVNARLYSADHRALLLLKCMMSSELPAHLYDQAAEAIERLHEVEETDAEGFVRRAPVQQPEPAE